MKKALIVLLAMVMVFAFAATAMAADTQYEPYGDINDQTPEIQSAIERLTILGALKGYNDQGTVYGPGKNITREEFATIGVRIAGLEDSVALYASLASAFKDVEEGRWSEGYVNCAKANGIMIGRGNGIFDPKANVTMQEVATVLLRAVGYTDALPGAWPEDYNVKAVNVGLCDYVDYIGPKAATRGEVASMVNEALDLWLVRYISDPTAQGFGFISGGTIDVDGFAYIQSKTNENEGQTLLENTFEARASKDAIFFDQKYIFSEGAAWRILDYEDWQLAVAFSVNGEAIAARDLADLYGISGGQDITDLAGQIGDVTYVWNSEKKIYEVVYIGLTSTIERTRDAGKDDVKAEYPNSVLGVANGAVVLPAKGFGEIYKDAEGKVYFGKDYSTFSTAYLGIVNSVSEKKIGEYFSNFIINLADKYNEIFYLLGEGFISAADVKVGDVIYIANMSQGDDVTFYLISRPQNATMGDLGTRSVTLNDFAYNAINNYSYYSEDGEDYVNYTLAGAAAIDWSATVSFVEAYAFNNFAYFTDNLKHAGIGVVYRYLYGSGNYLEDSYNNEPLSGVEILYAGDSKVTTVMFSKDFYEAQPLVQNAWPEEGSLVEFNLNADGELIDWKVDDTNARLGVGFEGAQDSLYYSATNYAAGPVKHTYIPAEWNKAQTRLTMAGDVYTLADNADIFVVTTFGPPTNANKLNTAKWMSAAEFKAEYGDFTAGLIAIYAAEGTQINTLYVKDPEALSDEQYGFGMFNNVDGNALSGFAAVIDGRTIPFADAKKVALLTAFDNWKDAVLVAYKLTDGKIADVTDVVFITSAADLTNAVVVELLKLDEYKDYAFNFDTIAAINDGINIELTGGSTLNIDATNADFVTGYDYIGGESVADLDYINGLDGTAYVGKNIITVSNADHDLLYVIIY